MLTFFRSISILEGLSYLAVLSVTLGFVGREHVATLGMVHGLLFMLYLAVSLAVSGKEQWSLKVWLPVFAASLVPLAFIPVELYLRKLSSDKALSAADDAQAEAA